MKKIRIIDDHPDMHQLLVWQLELMGFEVLSTDNGVAGVEIAVAEKPDLILMDIMMRKTDGLEATRMLRARTQTKEMPILATTARSRPTDLRACIEPGCNAVIVKPFAFFEPQAKIHDLLSAS
jgi:CheY-like chemotaxis protein